MQAAELFSQKHFAEVVQQEEFMLLSQSEVEKLIKCDEIQVRLSALTFSALFQSEQVQVHLGNLYLLLQHSSQKHTEVV